MFEEILQTHRRLRMKIYFFALSTLALLLSCTTNTPTTSTQSPNPAASASPVNANPNPSMSAVPVVNPTTAPVAITPDIPGKMAAMKACVDALPDSNPFKKGLSFALGQNITAINIYAAQNNMSAMQLTYDNTVTTLKQVAIDCVR